MHLLGIPAKIFRIEFYNLALMILGRYDTSTASLTSSVNHYIFENGRRYHAYFGTEKNLLPTDEVIAVPTPLVKSASSCSVV
jgi:hypothetical protein